MSQQKGYRYLTSGWRWRWGFNKYEWATIQVLAIILAVLMITTFMLCWLVWEVPVGWSALLGLGAGVMGLFLVKLLIPAIWNLVKTAFLTGFDETAPQDYRQVTLLQAEPSPRRADSWISWVTLGLLRVLELPLKPDRIYLVDGRFGDVFIYTRPLAQDKSKMFYKLNVNDEVLALDVVSMPSAGRFEILVEEIPSFDVEQFGGGAETGFVNVSYQVVIEWHTSLADVKQGRVFRSLNPLDDLSLALWEVCRDVLPGIPYKEVIQGKAIPKIREALAQHPNVPQAGLRIKSVSVRGIEKSESIAASFQEQFNMLLGAESERKIALELSRMDEEVYKVYLQDKAPDKAIDLQIEVARQMAQIAVLGGQAPKLLTSLQHFEGSNTFDAQSIAGPLKQALTEEISSNPDLSQEVLEIDQPFPEVPPNLSHGQRLRWARTEINKRVPHLQPETGDPERFEFLIEGRKVVVNWPPMGMQPSVYVEGQNCTDMYTNLKEGVFDYNETRVWDVFQETQRRLDSLPTPTEEPGYDTIS
jgi:hypothetical protein